MGNGIFFLRKKGKRLSLNEYNSKDVITIFEATKELSLISPNLTPSTVICGINTFNRAVCSPTCRANSYFP